MDLARSPQFISPETARSAPATAPTEPLARSSRGGPRRPTPGDMLTVDPADRKRRARTALDDLTRELRDMSAWT